MELKFEHFATQGQIRHQIQKCEGKHKQQVVYSTYHDALTPHQSYSKWKIQLKHKKKLMQKYKKI